MGSLNKILVANRGEIARRVIASCRRLGIASVAVFSEADAGLAYVAEADEAYLIGPPRAQDSYLRVDRLLDAAARSGADAVHPGYGFLSESPGFAEAVESSGRVWIGPAPQTIRDMGDKQRARDIALEAGVPIVPGSRRFDHGELDGLNRAASEVGYPLLVKAAAGGGGIGMRRVDRAEQLHDVAVATQSMGAKAFGNGAVFLERFIPKARHIEIQVFGFGEERAIHLYERDCSLQRRFQKVIEECPAPHLPQSVRDRMAAAALAVCRKTNYRSAGTVEFIVDAESFAFYFLEMNTRIQVEHPVTEMVTGLDLIAMQIDLARDRLNTMPQDEVSRKGHAFEARIYAENPLKNFMPSPGRLERFRLPNDGRVRINSSYREGDMITPFYDPMVAKVISHGDTREEARRTMISALKVTEIQGIRNNRDFLIACFTDDAFVVGDVSTAFIDNHLHRLLEPVAAE